MGPRSENSGYFYIYIDDFATGRRLQWVHGRRTVVIRALPRRLVPQGHASMGPRSENRGYCCTSWLKTVLATSFNGSTVGEPWLFRYPLVRRHELERASMGP